MRLVKAPNMTALFHRLCDVLVNSEDLVPGKDGKGYNHRGEFYIHPYDFFCVVQSAKAPDLYLEDFGYASNGAKITHLMKKYLDPEAVRTWRDFTKKVVTERPEVFGEIYLATKVQHKEKGGCVTGFMYRGVPDPTLIVLSRSMEMPAKAAADVLMIASLARLMCKTLGLPDIKVHWFTTSIVLPSRRAFIYRVYKWPEEVVFKNEQFQKYLDDGWAKYYLTDYEFSYAANQKTKELFLKKKAGTLKHTLDADAFFDRLEDYIA